MNLIFFYLISCSNPAGNSNEMKDTQAQLVSLFTLPPCHQLSECSPKSRVKFISHMLNHRRQMYP